MAQVLTANRLDDGEVVYLAADGTWVLSLSAAKVLATAAEGAVDLKIGEQAEREQLIVHAYLFDVTLRDGQVKPVKMREVIRAAGPTVRRDLGKQAVA